MGELTRVHGIGARIEEALGALDPPVATLADLVAADPDEVDAALDGSNGEQVRDWQAQADALRLAQDEVLQQAQDEVLSEEKVPERCVNCLREGTVTREGQIFACSACWHRWPAGWREEA